ncbi:deoxyhypusine hydroxylase-B isoform X2 [Malania oleifera]|uniref:deoxyhypusine hydroxylase-B isoform X2 n=1 Tax=Malania oleifera TaxID=397392 RepID=UPI0025AE08AC|nr:deoxyhypusine hydroxylase-B isoform X2 [Malania oleifera]XP_057965356.1 deoxyhypusine hydroxylase-B isoform X2 [Malania oleifera]XP_057965358.1 deoxyhypusine hydroxylase-B isoform X2 [Malania oleifera]XP_057965359.1 deoxyhypusine hydroxylase-B isoform X2 [Malania oleifera]XP_057965360.1 deoxyhypusine hydroxylase-B isoform X2 [Malania oleifera]XP_057965361.1 deoxyhypusine hydroxylase-B isoform X2 [Malania oleifera]
MVSCGNSFESSPEMETFLCERLLDSDQPISERFRALFSLRNLKGPAPRNALVNATRDSSNLLAHEAAFALGQMQDIDAVPALEAVLNDLSLHPIVRHEAAEALGAIGLESNVPLLKNSLAVDPALEVQETCELALRRIEEMKNVDGNGGLSIIETSPFLSVDPAAPASCYSVEQLREVLLNEDKGMYERYAALFALRNCGGDDAITAIIDSLAAKSALLRHEVAYVLGQLQNKAASAVLCQILRDVNEHPMVRHEAAEALGSIADDHSVVLLEEFSRDPEPLVSESCQVALSMLEFEKSGKSFEYLFMQTPQVEKIC